MDFEGESDAGPLRFAEDQIDNHTAKFDLTCYVFQKGETIEVVFNYRDELLNKSTVDQFLDQYDVELYLLIHYYTPPNEFGH